MLRMRTRNHSDALRFIPSGITDALFCSFKKVQFEQVSSSPNVSDGRSLRDRELSNVAFVETQLAGLEWSELLDDDQNGQTESDSDGYDSSVRGSMDGGFSERQRLICQKV